MLLHVMGCNSLCLLKVYKQNYPFIKHLSSQKLYALITCGDDIIVINNEVEEIEHTKICLTIEFEIKCLGRLNYVLGIEVVHSHIGVFILQLKYVIISLRKYECQNENQFTRPLNQISNFVMMKMRTWLTDVYIKGSQEVYMHISYHTKFWPMLLVL